ncbi:MAG: glycosyltransferase family 4 protein [Alphaproteobacteria bacterium]|nr:glycosyltransferase family 4 protein [Alphaproteobacteria bacterium]
MQISLTILLFVTIIAFFASWGLTALLRKRLLAKAIMDVPNERSMHTLPVPRGGGLSVMATILAGLSFCLSQENLIPIGWLLAALGLLLCVSWIDDKKHVNPALRLVLHLVAASMGSLALGNNALLFGGLLPLWLDRAVMILGWGWFMNLYNFMDGIDGITGTQTICCAVGAGLLLSLSQVENVNFLLTLCALIVGSCLGFLMLNWHPAKIFLGDVGSVPLGFLIGFLLLKLATQGTATLLPSLLIPLYYIADSGITITRRLLRGEKVWQAHRQHFYQRATLGEGSPVPIVAWVLVTNIGLIACALLSRNDPWLGAGLGVGILLLLLAKMTHSARKASKL